MPSMMSVAERKRVLQLVWLALVSAVVMYGVVRAMIAVPSTNVSPSSEVLGFVLMGLAMANCLGAWWWYRVSLGRLGASLTATGIQQLTEDKRLAIQLGLQSSAIVCGALLEAVAVYGLLGSMIHVPIPFFFEGLAGVSLAGLLVIRLRVFPEVFRLLDQTERGPV